MRKTAGRGKRGKETLIDVTEINPVRYDRNYFEKEVITGLG